MKKKSDLDELKNDEWAFLLETESALRRVKNLKRQSKALKKETGTRDTPNDIRELLGYVLDMLKAIKKKSAVRRYSADDSIGITMERFILDAKKEKLKEAWRYIGILGDAIQVLRKVRNITKVR